MKVLRFWGEGFRGLHELCSSTISPYPPLAFTAEIGRVCRFWSKLINMEPPQRVYKDHPPYMWF